jgi:formylglycine-generating enzyme required for sulfatase activity
MTEERKVQRVTPLIFNDEPVGGHEEVHFQFKYYADTLARLVAAKSTRTPLTVGVFGEWGTGKTTLMQAIQARLEETEKFGEKGAHFSFLSPEEQNEFRRCHTVWFNAWQYSGQPEGTMVALIEAILRKMRKDGFLNKVYIALSDPKQPHLEVEKALLSILSKIISLGAVDLSKFVAESRFKQHLPFLDEFKTLFDRLLFWYLCRKVKGKLNLIDAKPEQLQELDKEGVLVIFIDDLDRCLPAKTVQVLETIKLMIGRPGTVFILGASERMVQEAIHTHYKQIEKVDREGTDCQQYLEKLIQVRFPLPPLRQDDIEKFVAKLLEDRPAQEVETLRQNLPLIAVGVPTNPRRIKTFVNFVELHWALLVNSNQDFGLTKDILTRWLLLDAAEPEFTKYVRELPPAVNVDGQTVDGQLQFVQDALRLARGEEVNTEPQYERWPKDRCRRLWDLLSQKGFSFELKPGELDRLIHLSAPPVHAVLEEKLPLLSLEGQAIQAPIGRAEKGVGVMEWPEWLPHLVRVPAGPFLMGSDKKQDPNTYGYELPQHMERSITRPYLIGKYPVTNAQFQIFVQDAEGYQSIQWWTKAGFQRRGAWIGPEKVGGDFALPNAPLVMISWYEAAAYCAWLTKRLQSSNFRAAIADLMEGDLKKGIENNQFVIRLPTEAEWEKAARGEDGRKWPWGNQFDPKKCNCSECRIGHTTLVGKYSPDGDSPYGCADMSGNVWEWCQTKWVDSYKKYDRGIEERESLEGDFPRVLRGGAFDDNERYVRCAFRNRYNPVFWVRYFGFRVVLSPL